MSICPVGDLLLNTSSDPRVVVLFLQEAGARTPTAKVLHADHQLCLQWMEQVLFQNDWVGSMSCVPGVSCLYPVCVGRAVCGD